MDYLMNDFQKFWHEHGEDWAKKLDYVEAATHLTMMGFLQRIVNGGGQIVREMASGSGRLDICVIYEGQKYPIELKIRYGDKYLEKGLEQTARYMDIHCCNEGWMVVFDRRKSVKWEDKLYMKKEIVDGKTITVVGV
jgi:RecB family endonuclease NucS